MTTTRALIIQDCQLDYVDGPMQVSGAEPVIDRIAAYVRANTTEYRRKYVTAEWHPGADMVPQGTQFEHFAVACDYRTTFPQHCIQGLPGSTFWPSIQALIDDQAVNGIYRKGQYMGSASAFESMTETRGYTLDGRLRYFHINAVDICGLPLESLAVTAVDARALGYQVRVLSDLTVPRFDDVREILAQFERYEIAFTPTAELVS